jgi:hypothetical protein
LGGADDRGGIDEGRAFGGIEEGRAAAFAAALGGGGGIELGFAGGGIVLGLFGGSGGGPALRGGGGGGVVLGRAGSGAGAGGSPLWRAISIRSNITSLRSSNESSESCTRKPSPSALAPPDRPMPSKHGLPSASRTAKRTHSPSAIG